MQSLVSCLHTFIDRVMVRCPGPAKEAIEQYMSMEQYPCQNTHFIAAPRHLHHALVLSFRWQAVVKAPCTGAFISLAGYCQINRVIAQ